MRETSSCSGLAVSKPVLFKLFQKPLESRVTLIHLQLLNDDASGARAERYDEEVKKKLGILWSEQKKEAAKMEGSKHGN